MPVFRPALLLAGLLFLAACVPGPGAPPSAQTGKSYEDYQRHKANRQSYMYQGL